MVTPWEATSRRYPAVGAAEGGYGASTLLRKIMHLYEVKHTFLSKFLFFFCMLWPHIHGVRLGAV